MNLQDQIRRQLAHEDLSAEQLARRLNQPLPNMRRALALMDGLEVDDKHRPLPKEVEVIGGKYRMIRRGGSANGKP